MACPCQLNFEWDAGHYLSGMQDITCLPWGGRRMCRGGCAGEARTGGEGVLHGLDNQKTQRNVGRG